MQHIFWLLMIVLCLSSCGMGQPPEVVSPQTPAAPYSGAADVAAPAPEATRPAPAPAAAPTTAAAASEKLAAPAAEVAPDRASDGAGEPMATGGGVGDVPMPTPPIMPTFVLEDNRAPLRAGEVDDNEQFAGYLRYLQNQQPTQVRLADVSERYLIRVINGDQQPLMGVQVLIYTAQGQQVWSGLTYAGGSTIFHPRVAGVPAEVRELRVVATQGNATTEATLNRDAYLPADAAALASGGTLDLVLREAVPTTSASLDLLFLLDTTGSMDDELRRIQDTIDEIASRINAFQPRPRIRFGLVAFRDVGEEYVTQRVAFSEDVADFSRELNALLAEGGGDTPEAVEEALAVAINELDWSGDADSVRLVFLVGDAGPHLDRQGVPGYLASVQQAVAQGIKIYPVAASNTDPAAEYVFRQLAQQTLATFVFLTYQPGAAAGAPGDSTPLEAGEQAYTSDRLDDIIVQIVERELTRASGVQ